MIFVFVSSTPGFTQNKKPITIEDYDQWKTISRQKISNDGKWLVYVLKPNVGNGEIVIKSLDSEKEYKKINGDRPELSNDSKWVAYTILPEDSLDDDEKKKIKNKMGLVNLETGSTTEVDSVAGFSFSEDGRWFVYMLFEKKEKKNGKNKEEEKKEKKPGTSLILKNLDSGIEEEIKFVSNHSMDKDSKYLVYSVSAEEDEQDGLYARELKENGNLIILNKGKGKNLKLSWSEDNKKLAFVSDKDDTNSEIPLFDLSIWNTSKENIEKLINSPEVSFPEGMVISENDTLLWSKDGKKLFFGIAPKRKKELSENEKKKLPDVDVWHWKDIQIQPQQKKDARQNRKRAYRAVYHFDSKKTVPLGGKDFPRVSPSPDGKWAYAISQKKYFDAIPWRFPNFQDVYITNTKDGSKTAVLEKAFFRGTWSPKSRYIVYYHEKHWFLYDVKSEKTVNLTKDMDIPFWNIDDDHPDTKRSYGGGYWLKDDEGVLINDKYDIWMFKIKDLKNPVNITGGAGRKENSVFRYVRLDREEKFIDPDKDMLLSFNDRKTKATGYFKLRLGDNRPVELIKMDKRISSLQKAKNADKYVMTIQTFEEFPNIYLTDDSFKNITKVTDANPQQKDYLWGSNELIEWFSMDGIPLQGVLTYPANYQKGKEYPMVVYIYEKLSNVMYTHFIPLANHRFNATVFASNGYAVFKPDIVYDIGHPGQSSIKCIVPGIQKIIEMGIADPKRIGLQGHSWGGYETAYIITQTDLFAAAISGAPVSNMTSAYGGIRWGSGLSRQFQYERTQSRIGGSLWEFPELYMENSPLFFLDRVTTPVLILHGDDDGAVPWYQGIELFVGLRRLGKEAIMLQYNNEPHHLRKKKNKYDFTRRMWEFYEYYLREKPAAEWIKSGVEYLEKGTK
jgi:dipeptidyl aminopeptidase/acylaminoacyl peptidase